MWLPSPVEEPKIQQHQINLFAVWWAEEAFLRINTSWRHKQSTWVTFRKITLFDNQTVLQSMLWSTNTAFLQNCDPITTLHSRKRAASTKLVWAFLLTLNITVANAWIPPVQTSRKSLDVIVPMGATLSSQEHAHGRHHANENEIHDNTRQSINSSSHEPHAESSIIDQNRHNHSEADTVDTASTEDWQRVCERFKNQLLDDSFLVYPIRGFTVEAADQYPHEDDAPPRLMPGTHKHLGGAYDATDGCIYGVPANSRCVLCLYPAKDKKSYGMKTIPLPKEIQEVRMKWLRGKLRLSERKVSFFIVWNFISNARTALQAFLLMATFGQFQVGLPKSCALISMHIGDDARQKRTVMERIRSCTCWTCQMITTQRQQSMVLFGSGMVQGSTTRKQQSIVFLPMPRKSSKWIAKQGRHRSYQLR